MQGELAQLISLTSYGNEYLKSGVMPQFYFPDHHTFKFCRVVDFILPKENSRSGHDEILGENPLAWFEKLKEANCNKLRLYYQAAHPHPLGKEHQFVGFVGGGGRWLMEAEMSGHGEYWLKNWNVTHKEDPERKIWTVHYVRVEENAPIANQHFHVEEVKNELEQVLNGLIQFCHIQNLSSWGAVFESGAHLLSDAKMLPENQAADLLVNKNYTDAARQLLDAINESWVFGGMGSWNDIGFEEANVQKEYDHLSEQLYATMMKGILASVNS